jgi:CRP/FNR family cyclic AMP-dependent transcriptional regulator
LAYIPKVKGSRRASFVELITGSGVKILKMDILLMTHFLVLDYLGINKGEIGMPYKAVLIQADIFAGIDQRYIDSIASICKEKAFRRGETIFEENSTGDELYVIASGEVEITVDPSLVSHRSDAPSEQRTIAHLRRGQSFGEIALVDQGIRSATARSASEQTQLLIIPREEILSMCDENPLLGYQLMRNLAADLSMKLRGTDFQIRDQLLQQRLSDD